MLEILTHTSLLFVKHSIIMYDKIEFMDETISHTFPLMLEQNWNIFVAKIQWLYGCKKLHCGHFGD